MKVLGLTGGIATGKSTICRTIREQGIPVVDCDEIAHQVVQKGNWGHRRVVKAFGGGVLQADGSLLTHQPRACQTNKKAFLETLTPTLMHMVFKSSGGRVPGQRLN